MQPAQQRPGAPAVVAYKQHNDKQINQYLRLGRFSPSLDPSQEQLMIQYAGQLRGLMSTGLNTAQYPLLYRGTDYLEFGLRGEEYIALKKLVGKFRTWKGFVSTSSDLKQAKKFSKGVVIFFHPSADTRFLDLSHYRDLTKHNQEREILLDHLTRGKITAVSRFTNASGLKSYVKVDVTL